MKYCTSCGSEMFDDAVVCTKCGRAAVGIDYNMRNGFNDNMQKNVPTNLPAPECKIVSAFNFVSSLLCSFSLFSLLLSLFTCYISTSISSYSSSYYYSSSYNAYSYFYPDEGFASLALVFATAAFGFGIATFIITLAKKQRGEKLFAGITKLIFGLLLFIVSVVALTY